MGRGKDSSLEPSEPAPSQRALYARDRAWLPCAQTPLPAAGAVGSAGMLRARGKRQGRGWGGRERVSPEPGGLLGWGGCVLRAREGRGEGGWRGANGLGRMVGGRQERREGWTGGKA